MGASWAKGGGEYSPQKMRSEKRYMERGPPTCTLRLATNLRKERGGRLKITEGAESEGGFVTLGKRG